MVRRASRQRIGAAWLLNQIPVKRCYRSRRPEGLVRACQLVGFSPDRDSAYLEINRKLRQFRPEVVQRTETDIVVPGAGVKRDLATNLLRIDGEFTVSIVLARRHETPAGGKP